MEGCQSANRNILKSKKKEKNEAVLCYSEPGFMAECLEEPSKHLAALYNASFVILSGKAFFPASRLLWHSLFKPPLRKNGGVRAPLSVDSRKYMMGNTLCEDAGK